MQLLPCSRPVGPLEAAPRTSLRTDSDGLQWEGFWCVADDGYYTRAVSLDGQSPEQWYRVADEAGVSDVVSGARVLPIRRRVTPQDGRRMLLLARERGAAILVGTSRRTSGARPRQGAGDLR